ncbi:MAG: 3-deoxy-manno-octulosonate cytidylyltransferase [Candidatus Zixiibacteriota bacterium]
MKIVGVIPSRLASKRFPGKALANVNGKAMILHVWERVMSFSRFERVIVATDDNSIGNLIKSHGGEVFLSSQPFRNGSERCAAAVREITCDIVIDIQGDEVTITPEQLERSVQMIESDPALMVATAAFPVLQSEDLGDPNLVKVAIDSHGHAIDFSRQPISITGKKITNYGHAGIYVYRKEFLLKYADLPQTPRELAESLEQLRILEHGHKIGVAIINKPLLSVNTPEDLVLANKVLSEERGV